MGLLNFLKPKDRRVFVVGLDCAAPELIFQQWRADLPNLRARLAQMAVRTEQARALLGSALDQIEAGAPEAPLAVLQTRLASLQAADAVTDLAMKACGGAAFSKHLGIDRVFRDARAGWVMAPTVDHLLEFSGRALTGLPLFG